MRYRQGSLILAGIFLVVGCGTSNILFEGKTLSDQKLKRDTITNIKYLTKIEGCTRFDKVNTKIIKFDPNKHISQEEWGVYGCGKRFDFNVKYQSDPKGGTFINISRKR